MAMPASGTSPGAVMGMYPLHAPMMTNARGSANAHAWPPLPSTTSPRIVGGQHPPVNANTNAQTFASYGVQYSNYGAQTTSYGTHTASFVLQNISYGETHDTSYEGHILNYESISHDPMGYVHSSNAPSMQYSSSMLQPTVESNPSHARDLAQLKRMDAKSLLVDLKGLIAQANEAAQKVASLVNIKLSMLPRKNLNPQTVVDSTGPDLETNDYSAHKNLVLEGAHRSYDLMTANTVFNDMLKSLKGNDSFYKDAPGVVQVPVFTDNERADSSTLPDFAKGERWAELTSQNTSERDSPSRNTQARGVLLPSRFWLLRKEVSIWKDLPSKYTSSLLQAAAGLTMVKQADLKRWLFTHARSYGVAYSRSLVNHIVVLLVFCLRAVYREATALTESDKEAGLIECRVLSESACWLSSQLSLLYDPVASKNLVLGLFKFALEAAAYCVTFLQRDSTEDLQEESSKVVCVEAVRASPEGKSENHRCTPLETYSDRNIGSSCVGDGVLYLQHLAAAVLAIQSQGALVKGKTCDSMAFQSSSSQRSAVHSMVVNRAEEVRATRADFRAVLEHDSLIWQRSQNQEYKKNKTKEEILAEERDYKRRRMSYRGKKVQRTPSEVLRDIIEGHMEEIVAAGGIGSFGRIPQDIQLAQSESELSALGIKDHSDAAQTKRSRSRDIESKEFGTSYSAYSRYSRSESRTDRGDGHRPFSVSSSSSSQRNDSSYQTRHKRSSHDHSADKVYERKYDSGRRHSRWEGK